MGCGGEFPTGFCDHNICFSVPPTGQDRCYIWAETWQETACPGGIPASCGDSPATAGCGQDAQYADNPRTFTCYNASGTETDCASLPTASENEVVTDSLTGLMWQRKLPDTYTGCTGGDPAGSECFWQEAIDYCDNLTYGGHSDWRFPNRFELQSLVGYGRYNPAIDTTAFPGTPSSWFWSSSSSADNTSYTWGVDFLYGFVHSRGKSETSGIRCVVRL